MEEQNSYITGVSHIAVRVPDIGAARAQYALLGFEADGDTIAEETFGVQALVMRSGPYVLELIAPLGADSPLWEQLEQTKQHALDHICYTVSDLEAQVALMKKNRFMVTKAPAVSEVWNRRAVLLGHRKMGVVELLEND